ncbi:MAG: hypothetical protein PUI85_04750 [Eubacteriales bacterium]|nr:hypothetical protein [Eubacteriales bacterium]MDY3332168.1 hypothetical protein [Gallibacter sp.]
MKKTIRKPICLAVALIMVVSLVSSNVFASNATKVQMKLSNFEFAKFKEKNEVEMYSDAKDVRNLLNLKKDQKDTNELNVTSDKFGKGGVLGFDSEKYLGQAMGIWIPDLNSDEDKQKLEQQGIKGYAQIEYKAKQFNDAVKKWDETDWDLENSYYEVKVKLPKNMIVDKEKLVYKWNLDKNGKNADEFLASLYDPQNMEIQGNTLIFKAKFKTLKSNPALNLIRKKPNLPLQDDSKNWNKQILKANIPVDINYKKDTNALEYSVDLAHSIKLVDKSGEILIEGSFDMQDGTLLPMDMSKTNIDAFPMKQYLDGDIEVNKNTESDDFYRIDKNKTFDLVTKLNVTPIKKTVGDPLGTLFGGMPGGKTFSDMQIFKFWPALDLGSEFSATLRFPEEIIVPDNIDSNSLNLFGAKDIFCIDKVEKSKDPITKETILKVYMPLTDGARKAMPSLHAVSKLISSVDNNLYLKVSGLKLSNTVEYGKNYTTKGTVGGKVYFKFITDVDDWVANEYRAELQEKFGEDIVKKDDIYPVYHFNIDNEKIEEAVDYMINNHPEIFSEVIPNLLNDAAARRKYDTNVYSLFANWIGKQEEGGRDYLYLKEGGNPDDITFTMMAEKSPAAPEKPKLQNNNPKTGDDSNLMLCVFVMFVSGISILISGYKYRKSTK